MSVKTESYAGYSLAYKVVAVKLTSC